MEYVVKTFLPVYTKRKHGRIKKKYTKEEASKGDSIWGWVGEWVGVGTTINTSSYLTFYFQCYVTRQFSVHVISICACFGDSCRYKNIYGQR